MDVEPTFSNLCERIFNDLFKSSNPTLFPGIELDLGYT
jgi:hypothetical protein